MNFSEIQQGGGGGGGLGAPTGSGEAVGKFSSLRLQSGVDHMVSSSRKLGAAKTESFGIDAASLLLLGDDEV